MLEINEFFILFRAGLDPSGYRHAMRQNQDDDEEAMLGAGQVSDEEKYRNCDRLKYICPNQNCRKEIIFDSAFTGTVGVFS